MELNTFCSLGAYPTSLDTLVTSPQLVTSGEQVESIHVFTSVVFSMAPMMQADMTQQKKNTAQLPSAAIVVIDETETQLTPPSPQKHHSLFVNLHRL